MLEKLGEWQSRGKTNAVFSSNFRLIISISVEQASLGKNLSLKKSVADATFIKTIALNNLLVAKLNLWPRERAHPDTSTMPSIVHQLLTTGIWSRLLSKIL